MDMKLGLTHLGNNSAAFEPTNLGSNDTATTDNNMPVST